MNEIIIDALERIKAVVRNTLDGLSETDLQFQPAESANSIAWLVWHLTRVQDDHIAELAKTPQVWTTGWSKKFGLALPEESTGYGHTTQEAVAVKASAKLLLGYYDDTHQASVTYISSLKPADYQRIVDKRWQPPVTLAARFVSIIADDLQHAGQAAYIRGLLPKD
jgi:hypothetical protein